MPGFPAPVYLRGGTSDELQFPEAQILAVEPAADNIEIAKLNLHAYPNVTLLQGVMGSPKPT
jgi:hypothetical protein